MCWLRMRGLGGRWKVCLWVYDVGSGLWASALEVCWARRFELRAGGFGEHRGTIVVIEPQ